MGFFGSSAAKATHPPPNLPLERGGIKTAKTGSFSLQVGDLIYPEIALPENSLPLKGRESHNFSPFKGEIERGMGLTQLPFFLTSSTEGY